MKFESYCEKTAVIGAGASGLACAIAQAGLGRKVTVFEHKDKACMKLMLTGNGKCNFTNAVMTPACFHENDNSILAGMLKRFTTSDAVDFIKSLGVDVCSKYGYYYPVPSRASVVAEALLKECSRQHVDILYGIDSIDPAALKESYDRVIFACGSRSHKETGSNGTGYKFLEHLGVQYTRILPALCELYCDDDRFIALNKGKRAVASICFDDKKDTGEIQITDHGISGIPVFNISRFVSLKLDMHEEAYVTVNFDPDERDVPEIIKKRNNINSYKPINGERIVKLRITKTGGFNKAQVCTGGVKLSELTDDFEIKQAPGFYVIGEMCDVDGICGGYNLHWAWLSGNLCAK